MYVMWCDMCVYIELRNVFCYNTVSQKEWGLTETNKFGAIFNHDLPPILRIFSTENINLDSDNHIYED